MPSSKPNKDDQNLQAVLEKISHMPEHVRPTMQRMHQVVMGAVPELKPRIWYGMPGYAKTASSPVLVFFRHDEYMTFGLTEKAALSPRDGDGLLMPCAWYFEELDEATEQQVAEIVRSATR